VNLTNHLQSNGIKIEKIAAKSDKLAANLGMFPPQKCENASLGQILPAVECESIFSG
jgi:hypothetical protein